jgi:hypothetical protein
MTETAETTSEVPATAPPVYIPRPKRVIEFSVPMLIGTLAAVIILGFVGGIAAQAIFPAKQGPVGHTGKQGAAGPAGPAGATGSAANVNFSAEGLCFNSSYFTDNAGFGTSYTWVSNVGLYTPTITNGAKSCPSGTFVPLEPAPGAQPSQ